MEQQKRREIQPYKFPDKINTTTFFRMDRNLILKKYWAALPLASKTIYPVIGVHTDANGVAFPSQETIGAIAGCTPKTVREGLDGLMGFPGFRIDHWVTMRGKRASKYILAPAPQDKGASFRIYKSFFEGRNWGLLSGVAHAVYPVMMAFSYFDYDLYMAMQDEGDDEFEYEPEAEFFGEGGYEQREFDIADPEVEILAEYAGVCQKSVIKALIELERRYFIAPCLDRWKMFLKPPYYFPVK